MIANIKQGEISKPVSINLETLLKVVPEERDELITLIARGICSTVSNCEQLTAEQKLITKTQYHFAVMFGDYEEIIFSFNTDAKIKSLKKAIKNADADCGVSLTSLCNGCHKEFKKLLKCGGCKCVAYCGTECAKKAWKKHKTDCKTFAETTQ